MTGHPLLDGAVLAVSFCNLALLLWLGLTVILNAERRTWAIRLAGGGVLLGAAFLIIHSDIYAQGWGHVSLGMELSWRAGWVLVILLPLTWYLLMLWYGGYWDVRPSPLRVRQRAWLRLAVVLAVALGGLLFLANPLPSYSQIADYEAAATPLLAGIPLWVLAYPLYVMLCIALALDVLGHPAPSGRMMGDLARARARPWLVGATLVLLAVSVLVAWVVLWVMLQTPRGAVAGSGRLNVIVAWFDLVIDGLISVAILLLGQAIVAYEIFTGRALPRRGLQRHWQTVALLAACYGLVAGGTLTLLPPVHGLLLTAMLLALSLAIFGRRSFGERERQIDELRPFVASLGLYERVLGRAEAAPAEADLQAAFGALAGGLLGARVAYLVPLGPAATLAGPPLRFPEDAQPEVDSLAEIVAGLGMPPALCLEVDPAAHGGAAWAVPLVHAGGIMGLLLLGDKRDGSLYTREEIEMARAGGERLVDTAAGLEIARRLVALQRQRLAESQVLDQRARRVLHDDVLPRLHAAILGLSAQPEGGQASDALTQLAGVHRDLSALLRELPAGAPADLARLGLAGALQGVVEQELAGAFDAVAWEVSPEAEAALAEVPPRYREVLYYAAREALRNAARHGRGADAGRPLNLRVALGWRGGLELSIEDSGVGVAKPRQGGQGLALHSTLMAVIGGSLTVESLPGLHTRITLLLPRGAG